MKHAEKAATAANLESLFIEVFALAGRLKRPLLPQGADLDVGQRRVLQVLAHQGPLTVPQIGRLLGTSRQNIQVIVNRLKTDGCIDVVLNPAHERSVLIQTTDHGRSLVTPSIEEETRIFGELNAGFSQTHLGIAINLLQQIRQRLEAQATRTNGHAPVVEQSPAPKRTASLPRPQAAPTPPAAPAPETFEENELPINLL